MSMRVLAIGHSHLGALEGAAGAGSTAGVTFDFVQMRRPEFGGKRNLRGVTHESPDALPPALRNRIRESAADLVALCMRGNEYNVLCLVEHPQRFDFALPGNAAALPLDRTREVLPYDLVERVLRQRMRGGIMLMRALRAQVAGRMVQLEVPPPIPSEAHIRKHAGVFRDMVAQHGVTPALVRYKLWQTQANIMQAVCRKQGIDYLPVPATTQDAAGMLVPAAWSDDPTHGNAWYGEQVLLQLAQFAQRSDLRNRSTP